MHIEVKRGLDIPIQGKPTGEVQPFRPSGEGGYTRPRLLALDVRLFDDVKFKILVKVGEVVKQGQPLLFDKSCPERKFLSPAAGVIKEVRRGHKRAIVALVIEVADEEQVWEFPTFDWQSASREALVNDLLEGGLFAHIRRRPFNRLASPHKIPRSIFVKAIETAPFAPPAELHVSGLEEEFQVGLSALAKLTEGDVHLVHHKDSSCPCFLEAQDVVKHTAEGPHPAGTHSLHIQRIDPILSYEDRVWTLNAYDVVAIGFFLKHRHPLLERVISIAGPSLLEKQTGYFRVRAGFPVQLLLEGRLKKGTHRFISGDPLMGTAVVAEDFLGFSDFVFCAIPEQVERQFLHFFRWGADKYTASKAYASGFFKKKKYKFTTSQHGEERAFIDATAYDGVMPLPISTVPLVRAVQAKDYDLAEALGLLQVDAEDFALPTFVCPSKVEMTEIIKEGLKEYAVEVLE